MEEKHAEDTAMNDVRFSGWTTTTMRFAASLVGLHQPQPCLQGDSNEDDVVEDCY